MTVLIDNYYGTPGSAPYLTSSMRTDMVAALSSLGGGSATGALLTSIGARFSYNVIFTTFSVTSGVTTFPEGSGVYLPWGAAQSSWRSALTTHFANDYDQPNGVLPISFDPDHDIVIYFEPAFLSSVIAGSFNVYDEDGSPFAYQLTRLMFHELAHVASQPDSGWSQNLGRNVVAAEIWESDTVATNAEDIIYRTNFTGQPAIAGHAMIAVDNFAGVSAFDLLNGVPTMALDTIDGRDVVIFQENAGGRTARKYIYEREISSPGSQSQTLNHYVVNETVETTGGSVVSDQGTLSTLASAALAESAASDLASKAGAAAETLEHLVTIRDEQLSSWRFKPADLRGFMSDLPNLEQRTARMISAESSSSQVSTTINVEWGPLLAGNGASAQGATYLPIAASNGVGTVLVGASAFDERNVDFTARLDDLKGGSGNDLIVGGDGSGPNSTDRSILDGGNGDDIIVGGSGRSSMLGGGGNDLLLAGSGDTLVDGGTGDDMFAFFDRNIAAEIDLSDRDGNGYIRAAQGSESVRVKGVEIYLGGEVVTTFKGSGASGQGGIFVAGSGGGIFEMRRGDSAFGFDGAVDIYRIDASVPASFAEKTEEEKIEYLRTNRIYIGNFEDQDEIYVKVGGNWVLFDGNQVSSELATAEPIQPNQDQVATSVWLTGSSSFNTLYPQAQFEVRGSNDASYVYDTGSLVYRDVSYAVADSSGLGIMTFTARTAARQTSFAETFLLDQLSGSDEFLSVVIHGFEDGEGGISFTDDGLTSILRGQTVTLASETENYSWSWGNILLDPIDVTNPLRLAVDSQLDLVDGAQDGWIYGGGASVDSSDPDFNLGERPYQGQDIQWEDYVLGALYLSGTSGNDNIEGSDQGDRIEGGDGDDTLVGGDGDDRLYGQGGEDILIGNAGNDLLDGGADDDELEGGSGDDTYFVGQSGDVVTENSAEGADTIVTTLPSFTLGSNVEGLIYQGLSNFAGTGNALDNYLQGGDGDDELAGGDGNDSFGTSDGSDDIDGGDGVDTLMIDGDTWSISISENGGVYTVTDYSFGSSASLLTSVERIHFSYRNASFSIAEILDPSVTGTNGNDTLLEGNRLDNEIFGLDGDDVLAGGGGFDMLDGGDGADIAWFSGFLDEYQAYFDTDGSLFVDSLDGNEAAWLVDIEAMYFAGDDVTLLPGDLPPLGTSGNDVLVGTTRHDALMGNAGNDSLDALSGHDAMQGGEGDDSYVMGEGDDNTYDEAGDDNYLYAPGDGDDQIWDYTGTDYLEFATGIDPNHVTVTADETSYVLTIAGIEGSLTIGGGAEMDYAVEEVRFADTTVWTDEDLYDMAFGQQMRGGGGELYQYLTAPETIRMPFMADFHVQIA